MGVTGLVALAGILMAMRGFHLVAFEGAGIAGTGLIVTGLLLQVASGAFGIGNGVHRGSGLNNPFRVLNMALKEVRTRVRGWDDRA